MKATSNKRARPVSPAEARKVACPDCGVGPTQPCVSRRNTDRGAPMPLMAPHDARREQARKAIIRAAQAVAEIGPKGAAVRAKLVTASEKARSSGLTVAQLEALSGYLTTLGYLNDGISPIALPDGLKDALKLVNSYVLRLIGATLARALMPQKVGAKVGA